MSGQKEHGPWKLDSVFVCKTTIFFLERYRTDPEQISIRWIELKQTKFVYYNIDELELNPNDLKVSEE